MSVVDSHVQRIVLATEAQCLTNIIENHTFVPRARYLRLLRRRWRYKLLYPSVLRLCSDFRESRPSLWLDIKKSIFGKSPCMKKMRRDQPGTRCLVNILEYPDFGLQEVWDTHVVRCDEGVNIFSEYVYDSGRRYCCRLRACPRVTVIFTSL